LGDSTGAGRAIEREAEGGESHNDKIRDVFGPAEGAIQRNAIESGRRYQGTASCTKPS